MYDDVLNIYVERLTFNLNFELYFVVSGMARVRAAVFGFCRFYNKRARGALLSEFVLGALFQLHSVSEPLHTAALCCQLSGQVDDFTHVDHNCVLARLLLELDSRI